MRVIFLVPYPGEGPSNRYRIGQYLPYLEQAGIRYRVCSFWSKAAFRVLYKDGYYLRKIYFFIIGTLFRLINIFQSLRYDIVFIHREAYPLGGAFFEIMLKLFKKPVIFDFDDSIFLPSTSKSNSFMDRFKNPHKVVQVIKLSRHVIAGNNYLAEFAAHYNSAVSVIPTAIDTERYKNFTFRAPKPNLIIGWMGSVTTIDFIDGIRNVILKLSKKYPQLEFRIIGGDYSIRGLSNITSKPWLLETELSELGNFDIGIMPMPDNIWTRGKCGFKAILYMTMGIPCVCSPVGANKEIVSDGVNGFLADTESGWTDKLSLLIENPQLRQKLGSAGRRTVEERYSIAVNAPKILGTIQKLYSEYYGEKDN